MQASYPCYFDVLTLPAFILHSWFKIVIS
jgi:hypothetical protein